MSWKFFSKKDRFVYLDLDETIYTFSLAEIFPIYNEIALKLKKGLSEGKVYIPSKLVLHTKDIDNNLEDIVLSFNKPENYIDLFQELHQIFLEALSH